MNNLDNSLAAQTVIMVSTDVIKPNPYQPRKVFKEGSLSALSESISENGILEPLLVRKSAEGFELIAGERRLRASKMAGIEKVPCIVRNDNDGKSAELALIENIQRENLNMFEEAAALLLLLKNKDETQESLSKKLSCSQSYIANKIRLLNLGKDIIEIILVNNLTERHARALLKVPEGGRKAVLQHIISNNMNVNSSENFITEYLESNNSVDKTKSTQRKLAVLKKKMLSKDMKLFYNSLDKLLNSIRDCGMDVAWDKSETDNISRIVIEITK